MTNKMIIDIDTERDNPIKISKEYGYRPDDHEIDDIIKQDIRDLSNTIIYVASMLDEDIEKRMIAEITDKFNKRKDEVFKDTEIDAPGKG